ncbi:MAG: UDP-3-O-(3-hydroxymyristoyl)glucosamine N-acyltransferase [Flavobacteriaceae bacterium]|nr:UDP-3-O-(3-hydroxymyristoyl)glucosamine N-acyltransferase [Flavobacteriaceae bacterium]
MKFTAAEIANLLEGTVDGDDTVEISSLSKIEESTHGSLTFLANPKYTQHIYTTNASLVIVNKDFKLDDGTPTLIRVTDAYHAFSTLLEYYNKNIESKKGIETSSIIDSSSNIPSSCYIGNFTIIADEVKLRENVIIGSHVTIEGDVSIGENTKIDSFCVIKTGTKIGSNCHIHSGCVIGSDGFGYTPNEDGTYKKIPHTGNVEISEHVEIGANSTIDRATLGSTRILRGVKMDNQIQIAHNVEIGANTVIAAQTGIAGSTKIGPNCIIGGQVGIIGHLKIGKNVSIQGQSGIISNIKDGSVIQGSPAISYKDYNKSYVYFRRFPSIIKRLESLEKNKNE